MFENEEFMERVKNYFRRTRKNKMVATLLFVIGVGSVLPEGDATAALLLVPLSILLFFARQNWID